MPLSISNLYNRLRSLPKPFARAVNVTGGTVTASSTGIAITTTFIRRNNLPLRGVNPVIPEAITWTFAAAGVVLLGLFNYARRNL